MNKMYSAIKKSKAIILLFLLMLNLILVPVDAKAAETLGENYTSKPIVQQLVLLGCPEDFLTSLSPSTLNKLIQSIETYDICDVRYSTKDCNNDINIDKNLLIKSITVDLKQSQTGEYAGRYVCIYWEWLNKAPVLRNQDYISLMWDKDSFSYATDTFYAEDYCKNKGEQEWSITKVNTVLARMEQGKLGHWCDLDNSKDYVAGTLMVTLIPTSTENAGIEHSRIYIEYTHKNISVIVFLFILLVVIVSISIVIRRKKSGKCK